MRHQIYSADTAVNDEIRAEFSGQYLIYDPVALEDIADENGIIAFESECDAQEFIDNNLS